MWSLQDFDGGLYGYYSPVEIWAAIIIINYVHGCALTLYLYDYILSFSDEVSLIWKGQRHYTTWLYFLARYFPFLGIIYQLVTFTSAPPPLHPDSCTRALHFVDIFNMSATMAITAILIGQTYVVYGSDRRILMLLIPLGLAVIGVDIYKLRFHTCGLPPLPQHNLQTGFFLVLLTAFPIAVLLLTLFRVSKLLYAKIKVSDPSDGQSLLKLIAFETICMSGVCVLRILSVLLFYVAPACFSLGANPFVLPVSAIFITHFLLNLRKLSIKDGQSTCFTTLPHSVLNEGIVDLPQKSAHFREATPYVTDLDDYFSRHALPQTIQTVREAEFIRNSGRTL